MNRRDEMELADELKDFLDRSTMNDAAEKFLRRVEAALRSAQAEPGYVAGFEACRYLARGAALGERCERNTPWDLACTTIAAAIAALPAPATASVGEEVTVDELARFLDPDAFDGTTDPNLRIRRNQFITQKARALLSTYKITKRSAT